MSKRGYSFHGFSGTSTYVCWHNMLKRCQNENNPEYPRYGGRGIKVCERWQTFPNFLSDMGLKPRGLSLDRRDNNGNYEPSNCRWATKTEQSLNTRRTSKITANGVTRSVKEWADDLGCDDRIIWKRLTHLHWTPEQAVTIPVADTWTNRRLIAGPARG